jgi:hypothetical protein
MSAALADRETMRRDDTAVKVDTEVVRKAKVVAADRGIPLAKYLSEALRPIVEKDYRDQARKALGDEVPPKLKGKS